jgi:hypothetical protein
MRPDERDQWRRAWRGTLWELAEGDGWRPLPDTGGAPAGVVVSAWNPHGVRLPDEVNRARDQLLLDELRARGLQPRRARGRSPDGAWSEDGWLVEHRHARSVALLGRYQQLAGLVVEHGRAHLLWRDGWLDPA